MNNTLVSDEPSPYACLFDEQFDEQSLRVVWTKLHIEWIKFVSQINNDWMLDEPSL